MPRGKEAAGTAVLDHPEGNSRLGLKYIKRRLDRKGADKLGCIDYAIHSADEARVLWGEIRVDRHSSRVVVIRVAELVAVGDTVVPSPKPMEPVKFSSENDAVQGLRLLREFQLQKMG
jgi:hypothetical protein